MRTLLAFLGCRLIFVSLYLLRQPPAYRENSMPILFFSFTKKQTMLFWSGISAGYIEHSLHGHFREHHMSKVLTHTCTGACMRDVPGSINFESWGKCPREKGAKFQFFIQPPFFINQCLDAKKSSRHWLFLQVCSQLIPNIKESHVFVSKHGKKTIKSADLTTLFYMAER